MTNKKGFTLIELLVVVLIIGILAAIALPQYFKAVEKSRATEALSIMGSFSAAMERARLVKPDNKYPTNLDELDIQFADKDGVQQSGDKSTTGWETKNFKITYTGGDPGAGIITATRSGTANSGYVITRNYYSGKVTCKDGSNSGQVCASLGLTVVS